MSNKPLDGITVIEYSHMVMGPCCGVILADLGAEVIKVEPIKGDNTRRLKGSGAGYFPMYNRGKRSVSLDVNTEQGLSSLKKMIDTADVFIENFKPNGLVKWGLDADSLHARNKKLIYCSLKGFGTGPYENRTALDEVVQMFSGLAYMTGLPEKPMRAGTSVVDITGAMFGVIAILSKLQERNSSGRGGVVKSSLFETAAFLVGQHIAQASISGEQLQPMSIRQAAWSVYDIFTVNDGSSIFVGVVSDTQWRTFCDIFELKEFIGDASLSENNKRVLARNKIIPVVQAKFMELKKSDLISMLQKCGLPYAPILKPTDLPGDTHMNSGWLQSVEHVSGDMRLPSIPIELDSEKCSGNNVLPEIGEGNEEFCSTINLHKEHQ